MEEDGVLSQHLLEISFILFRYIRTANTVPPIKFSLCNFHFLLSI